jgi:hypothetical protein
MFVGGLTQAEFEKEPYMTPFNWFVTDTIETMNTRYLAWIVRCSSPPGLHQHNAPRSLDVSPGTARRGERGKAEGGEGEVVGLQARPQELPGTTPTHTPTHAA